MKDVKHIIIFAIIAEFCLTGCGLAIKKADFFSVRERKLGREVKEKMPALGEDYAKVSWERVYGISREYPGIVISTATFENKRLPVHSCGRCGLQYFLSAVSKNSV